MAASWEDMISLNNNVEAEASCIGPVEDFLHLDEGRVVWDQSLVSRSEAICADRFPLPSQEDREGYYGDNHYDYWASGQRDLGQIASWAKENGIGMSSILDVGCASGRLLRHAFLNSKISTYGLNFHDIVGCDINRRHIDWVSRFLPPEIKVFQNTSLPLLPIPDSSFDLVTAFSVFTHVETFDTGWLMEFSRILRRGGTAWISIHGDRTWQEVDETWPLWKSINSHPDYQSIRHSESIPSDRVTLRWHADRSYSSNIFYRYSYVKRTWGRIMKVAKIMPALPPYQDIVVLRKE